MQQVGSLPQSLIDLINKAINDGALVLTVNSMFGVWANIRDSAVSVDCSAAPITDAMLEDWVYALTGDAPSDVRFATTKITVSGQNVSVTIERKHRATYFSFLFLPSITSVKVDKYAPESEFIFV